MTANATTIALLTIIGVGLSIGLNALVDHLESDGSIRGYRAALVMIGAAYVIGLSAIITPLDSFVGIICIAFCSLVVMVAGDIRRQRAAIRESKEFWDRERAEAGDGY